MILTRIGIVAIIGIIIVFEAAIVSVMKDNSKKNAQSQTSISQMANHLGCSKHNNNHCQHIFIDWHFNRSKDMKNKKLIAIMAALFLTALIGNIVVWNMTHDGAALKVKTQKQSAAVQTVTTTTLAPTTTIVPRETIYVTNPADAATQAKLDKCRAALDKYSNAVETLRQTIRTYDDATMTNNSELANIALNSNALSVIPGLAAEYERCYQ